MIVPMRTLLRAALADLDTVTAGRNVGSESFRRSGMVLMVNFVYRSGGWGTVDLKVTANFLRDTEHKSTSVSDDGDGDPTTAMIYDRHGIRVQVTSLSSSAGADQAFQTWTAPRINGPNHLGSRALESLSTLQLLWADAPPLNDPPSHRG